MSFIVRIMHLVAPQRRQCLHEVLVTSSRNPMRWPLKHVRLHIPTIFLVRLHQQGEPRQLASRTPMLFRYGHTRLVSREYVKRRDGSTHHAPSPLRSLRTGAASGIVGVGTSTTVPPQPAGARIPRRRLLQRSLRLASRLRCSTTWFVGKGEIGRLGQVEEIRRGGV